MDKHYYAVIMAGGGGTRLWPLSRKQRPKQMLPLIGSNSLFQDAIRRLDGIFPPERIFIVTTAEMAKEFQLQCPEIPLSNFILEPKPRGTASVAGLAAIALQKIDPQAVIATLTSDHFIGNINLYKQLLSACLNVARQNHLVTLGITPTYPATGYGYIHHGSNLGDFNDLPAFKVEEFKEKPNLETARQMIENGNYSWNSGMFVWHVQTILDEFKRQMPALHTQLQTIAAAWDSEQKQAVIEEIWSQVEINTIDYGIMEGAQHVAVIPAGELDWNDVGAWDSMFDILPVDQNGNILIEKQSGQTLVIDSQNTLIQTQDQNRIIVAIGVDELVIVDTGDVLLICKKDQAQKVRQAVNQLKETHPNLV